MATLVQQLAQFTFKNQTAGNVPTSSTLSRPIMVCELCGGEHNSGECYNVDSQTTMEQVDLMGYGRQQQSYPQQGAYNPNAPRNHPGFSWSNPAGAANPQNFGNRVPPPGFQGQQYYRGGHSQQFRPTQGYQAPVNQPRQTLSNAEAPSSSNLEAMMEKLLKSQMQSEERVIKQLTERVDQLSAHNKMLENQLANQASTSSTRVTRKLPACPENPREYLNAITTRSGKQLQDPPYPVSEQFFKRNQEVEAEKVNEEVIVQDREDIVQEIEPMLKHTPPLSFPQKFKKSKVEERRATFLSLIKQLDISIPLLDAITEIPSYARFLKEILSNKRKFEDRETVAVNEECSALIQNKLPPKLRDSGSFSIPCVIGGSLVQRALCDLGANVSLMPNSLCKKLQLGEPKPTSMTLQLADRSVKYQLEF
ncbi:PREDICTED: uncharacterized protein LOC109152581 [Ipomoea nil]|uniref:uncharacterized protein LOC109152581 n=1 Tax=Ipomoea nil TaxID=35883 RepID=UPI0009012FEF|nr:PREDICTED: uncharacterized protein LOC109152581 [Ipomoea nil]